MPKKKTFISFVATLTIMFAGAVAAQGVPPVPPDDAPDTNPQQQEPVPDIKAQEKTEKMVKKQEALMEGADAAAVTEKVQDPTPDPELQKKTEAMLQQQMKPEADK